LISDDEYEKERIRIKPILKERYKNRVNSDARKGFKPTMTEEYFIVAWCSHFLEIPPVEIG